MAALRTYLLSCRRNQNETFYDNCLINFESTDKDVTILKTSNDDIKNFYVRMKMTENDKYYIIDYIDYKSKVIGTKKILKKKNKETQTIETKSEEKNV